MMVVRIALATLVAAAIGFSIHVYYGQGLAMGYVQAAAADGRLGPITQPAWPDWRSLLAVLTALLPTLGKVLLFLIVREALPALGKVALGLSFGFILLMVDSNFLSQPVMKLAVGNPADVVLVQSVEGWVVPLLMGLAMAFFLPGKAPSRFRRV